MSLRVITGFSHFHRSEPELEAANGPELKLEPEPELEREPGPGPDFGPRFESLVVRISLSLLNVLMLAVFFARRFRAYL